ncbi:MAG: VCBS repeat-containing protein, partial [Bacteroidota bacterium]
MKRFTGFALLFLFSFLADAQIPFERSALLKGGFRGGSFIEMADLDGDGDEDVVAAGKSRALAWYENMDGQGDFGFQNLITDAVGDLVEMEVGDLNGDGLNDIMVVWQDGGVLSWLPNQGNGVIASDPITIAFAQRSMAGALIVDLDSDGDNDVVYGFSNNAINALPLSWCENTDGAGNFAEPKELDYRSPQSNTAHFGAGDFDGDGTMDLAVGGANSVWVYYNNGDGSFETESIDITPSGGRHLLTVLDYDGDGDLDIASGINSIEWYQNNGGSFSAAKMLYSERTSDLQHGDFDGDGDMDLATVHILDSSLVWLENQGPNQPVVVHRSRPELVFPHKISAGDIDSDGDADLIVSPQIGRIARFVNTNGQGAFEKSFDVNAFVGWVSDMHTADVDGDGDLDFLTADSGADQLDWYENVNGDGSKMQQHSIAYNYDNASTIVTIDVDGDGDQDVVTGGGNDVSLYWFENLDGLGTFGEGSLVAEGIGWYDDLQADDVDGDGRTDVVASVQGGRHMYLFRNTGSSLDEGKEIFNRSHEFTDFLLVDIDRDGDPDIIATQKASPRIFWAENLLGDGEFSDIIPIQGESAAMNTIHASDVDGDSDLDLIYTMDDAVKWLENVDGIGNFGDVFEIDRLSFQSRDIELSDVKDLDNDGDEDIVIVSRDGLFWYENLGYKSGRWSARRLIDEEPDIYSLIADLSGDGVNDLLAYDLSQAALYFYENGLPPQNFITGHVNREAFDSCSTAANPVEGLLVSSSDGTDVYASYTNKNGQFLNKLPLGSYATTVANLPTGYTIDPLEQLSTISASARRDTVNFCIDPNELDSVQNDLSVHMFRLTLEARPGFDVFYQLIYRNRGTTTLSDTVSLNFPSELMDYLAASVEPTLISGNTIKWAFENLAPFEARKINLEFNIKPPPTVTSLTRLYFKTNVGPTNDDVPENNCQDYAHGIVNSFDPNDIMVLEGSEIKHQDYLRLDTLNYLNYMIRFQNTGTASAVNVQLANAIDSKLDWRSLDILSSSHEYRAEITDQDTLIVYYDGIYLPDSTTDLEGSQGYITYRIRMRDGLGVGATIFNDAEIYFDFNEPIYTNQVSTELTE